MSQRSRTHRIANIQEAIRSSIWLTLDLLAVARKHVDDEDTLFAIDHATGALIDQLSLLSKGDFKQVPF